ncbi:MAG TPA: hypothetical protein VGI39_43705 [Polyangiaceae bacterium]|jgi:hypothetical protein
MDRRRRIALLVLLGAGLAAYFTLLPQLPRENVLHIVLGAAAPQVVEIRLRYAPAAKNGPIAEDWTREVSFRFPEGAAPRVVTHEPRVADGDYVVEIEILKAARPSPSSLTLQRKARLVGGTTTIDVSEAAAR